MHTTDPQAKHDKASAGHCFTCFKSLNSAPFVVSQEGVEEELHHRSLKDVVPAHALYSKTRGQSARSECKTDTQITQQNQAKDSLSTPLNTQHVPPATPPEEKTMTWQLLLKHQDQATSLKQWHYHYL